MDASIFEIPNDRIEEILLSEPQTLFESEKNKCLLYLKNFDDYFILSIVDPNNYMMNKHFKLPGKFVGKHGSSSFKDLLVEFLKITGIKFPQLGDTYIMYFDHTKKAIGMHNYTYNGGMPFGIQEGNMTNCFFIVSALPYRDFLQEYQITQ